MTKVKNRKLIRKLAFRRIKTSPVMSMVIIISIMLTCIMFTSLTCLGGGLVKEMQTSTMRQVGGNKMAGLKYVLPEDIEKVKSDSSVKNVVYTSLVGMAVNEDIKNVSVEVNCAGDDESAKSCFAYPTTGRLPENEDEIAMSTIVLDELGIPHELGSEVPLKLSADERYSEHSLKLCGFWEGDSVAMAQMAWVSREFADKYAPTPEISWYKQEGHVNYCGYYSVDFDFSNSFDIEGKTVALISRLYSGSDITPEYGVNWAYATSNIDIEMVLGAAGFALVIFIAAYLIIYNIFHINISADIRSYGLLKTVGTTSKQIKHMVKIQAAFYCLMGIPLGLIIGFILSKALFGLVISSSSINSSGKYPVSFGLILISFAVSSLFTYITVMISCHKPRKAAGNVSPIQALRFNDTSVGVKKHEKRTKKVTPMSIARDNMSRSKKKTVIVVLSLTLSIILMNTVYNFVNGLDMDKYTQNYIMGDFIISEPTKNASYEHTDCIQPEETEFFENLEGAQVDKIYCTIGKTVITGETLASFKNFIGGAEDADSFAEFRGNSALLMTDIYGVDEGVLTEMEKTEGNFDREKFFSGKYAIVKDYYCGGDYSDMCLYEVGDKIKIQGPSGAEKEYEVLAVDNIPWILSDKSYFLAGVEVMIPCSEYLSLADNENAFCLLINAEKGCYDNINNMVKAYTENSSHLIYSNKETVEEEFHDFVLMVKLIGGSLVGILALIGVINFINADVTGIISRKRELAMMNAVGMTGSQIRKMLVWEGVIYAVFTLIFSLVFGSIISYGVVRFISDGMAFFTYRFTLIPFVFALPVLLALSAAVPSLAYKCLCKESVIERIREN